MCWGRYIILYICYYILPTQNVIYQSQRGFSLHILYFKLYFKLGEAEVYGFIRGFYNSVAKLS